MVVEDRYSQIFKHSHVRPSVIADGPAECQVAWPNVPIVFLETRALAQEWTYRFLAAARSVREHDLGVDLVVRELVAAKPLPPTEPTVAEVRAWALEHGWDVSDRGRLPRDIVEAYRAARLSERT